ncbi:phage tail tape measure protein [Paludibacterium yongneupense]|uniref:phage tail tape measure protein n=1 Tax=Paludibacterium yongneupense TaxID=400061 RepID=UPI000422B960|nr:phage tail tape measure protein [Paludibacterium yongneupense]
MSQNFLVSLLLKTRDELSGPLARILQTVKRDSADASAAVRGVGDESARMAAQRTRATTASESAIQRELAQTSAAYERQSQAAVASAESTTRATDGSLSKRLRDYQRFQQAWEALGLRSEADIQREIARTEAAYQRLARGGMMSADEQARAFDQMTRHVAELNREMGRLSSTERGIRLFQGGARGLRTVGDGILGGIGAAHAIATPVKETMAWDRRVAMMSNTAFNERDVGGRISGEAEIRGAIKNTISQVGGNLDQVTETLDNLLSHNTMTHDQVFRLLPVLQKYATAEGADPNELGNIAFRAIQNFGFNESMVPKALDMAIRGGHMGGFKLPDMAKWLPQQMAAAKNSGMNGVQGLASLIALNELSVTTSGTVDEAGNNVMDLLTHLNSRDTARSVKKYLHRDLSVMLANGRGKGQNSIEVFGDLLDQVAKRDKNYRLLQGRLANVKNDGQRRETLESMLDIVQGSAIGKIVHNRQELQALMAYVNQKPKYQQIRDQALVASGYGDRDFDVISRTDDYKTERAKSIAGMGEKDALRGFDSMVGDTAAKLANYGAQYPGLTAAVMGAKTAFEGVTQAILAIGLGRLVFGKGGEGAGGGETNAGGGGIASGAGLGALISRFRAGLGIGGGAVALANFTSNEEDEELANGDATWKRLHAHYSQQVIDAARKKYQPWYQFGEGYAAENEQWIKQYQADQQSVQSRNSAPVMPWSGQNDAGKLNQQVLAALQAQATAKPQPITINNQIHLDGHVIAEQVNQINTLAALRY